MLKDLLSRLFGTDRGAMGPIGGILKTKKLAVTAAAGLVLYFSGVGLLESGHVWPGAACLLGVGMVASVYVAAQAWVDAAGRKK